MITYMSDEAAERVREQGVRDRIIESAARTEIRKVQARRSRRDVLRSSVVEVSDTDRVRLARSRVPGHQMNEKLIVGREGHAVVDLDHDGDPYTWEGKDKQVKQTVKQSQVGSRQDWQSTR